MLTLDALHPRDEATQAAMERARAFQPHPALRFELIGAKTEAGRIVVTGVLTNDDAEAHEVIVFPAGPGGLYVELAARAGFRRRPPPPGSPPMPMPAPPPPQRYEVPAHARVRLVAALVLADYEIPAAANVDVAWTFHYWNEPRPHGIVPVRIP
jgi:hypothetical protein